MENTCQVEQDFCIDKSYSKETYDNIVRYIRCREKKSRSSGYFNSILMIKDMPPDMVSQLWPGNTQRSIIKLFISVSHRVTKPTRDCGILCEREMFPECWLYKQIQSWVADGTIDLQENPKLKKAIFELSILT